MEVVRTELKLMEVTQGYDATTIIIPIPPEDGVDGGSYSQPGTVVPPLPPAVVVPTVTGTFPNVYIHLAMKLGYNGADIFGPGGGGDIHWGQGMASDIGFYGTGVGLGSPLLKFPASMHTYPTNDERIVIPEDGIYAGSLIFGIESSDNVEVMIRAEVLAYNNQDEPLGTSGWFNRQIVFDIDQQTIYNDSITVPFMFSMQTNGYLICHVDWHYSTVEVPVWATFSMSKVASGDFQ
jgi:hypothetical protein